MVGKFFHDQRIATGALGSDKAPYIRARAMALNGRTVRQALDSVYVDGKGRTVKYKLGDLRYDVKRGFLVLATDEDAAIARLAEQPPQDRDYHCGWGGAWTSSTSPTTMRTHNPLQR